MGSSRNPGGPAISNKRPEATGKSQGSGKEAAQSSPRERTDMGGLVSADEGNEEGVTDGRKSELLIVPRKLGNASRADPVEGRGSRKQGAEGRKDERDIEL